MKKSINDLSHPDVSKRRVAAESLAAGDERAVYPLIKALRDENPGVQDAAMRSLIAMGGDAVAFMVVPLLREDSYLRNTAFLILKGLGRGVLPFVYPLLKDKDDDVRKFALDILGEIKEGVPAAEVVPLFKDHNPNVRTAAAKAAGALGLKEAVPELIGALKDDEWVCFSAIEALGRLGAEEAVPSIAAFLDDGSEALRYAAVEALGEIGTEGASAALLSHARRSSGNEKRATVKSLARMGVAVPEAAGILIDMLGGDDWEEKAIAIKGLSCLRECGAVKLMVDIAGALDDADPATYDRLHLVKGSLLAMGCEDALLEVIDSADIKYRGKLLAAEILGGLGSGAAVPHLKKLLEGDLRDVRRAAVEAMGKIDGAEARAVLVGLVEDGDGHIRRAAIRALGRAREAAIFDRLFGLLPGERYPDVLEETVKALLSIDPERLFSRIGGVGPKVRELVGKFSDDVDMLLSLADDETLGVRVSAISGFSRVSEDGRVFRKLSEAVRDVEPEVRRVAVMALGELNHCHDAIKTLLEDADVWVRMHAVEALGRCFTHDIIRTLRPLLRDKEPPVVLSAIEAIGKVGGKEAFSVLSPLRNHPDEAVRQRALRVLEGL